MLMFGIKISLLNATHITLYWLKQPISFYSGNANEKMQ